MSDDDFGLSSGDEDTLLQAENTNSLKRKGEDSLGPTAKIARRTEGSATLELANDVLRNRFRIDSFRLKQEAAIDRLLQGESAVVVFPTGTISLKGRSCRFLTESRGW